MATIDTSIAPAPLLPERGEVRSGSNSQDFERRNQRVNVKRLYLPLDSGVSCRLPACVDMSLWETGFWFNSPLNFKSVNPDKIGACFVCYDMIPGSDFFEAHSPAETVVIFNNNEVILDALLDAEVLPKDIYRKETFFLVRADLRLAETVHIVASLGFSVVISLDADLKIDFQQLSQQLLQVAVYAVREEVAKSQVQPIISRLFLNRDPLWKGPAACLGGPLCYFVDRRGNLKTGCFGVIPDSDTYAKLNEDDETLLAENENAKKLILFKEVCGACQEYTLCKGSLVDSRGKESKLCEVWRNIGNHLDKTLAAFLCKDEKEVFEPFALWKDRWLHLGP